MNYFRCLKIWENLQPNCNVLIYYILGHLKTINFLFGTNGKLMVLGVPILKHCTVIKQFSLIVKCLYIIYWDS